MNFPIEFVGHVLTLLISASFISLNYAAANQNGPLLKRVCRNAQIPIESVEQAKQLIHEVWQDANHDVCLKKYTKSFFDLEHILDKSQQLIGACSDELFDMVRDYHFRYINPPREVYKFGHHLDRLNRQIVYKDLDANELSHPVQLDASNHALLIPISLQQFFKAFAMQLSGLCKRTLADNLNQAMSRLTDRDHELMERLFTRGLSSKPANQAKETPAESPAETTAETSAEKKERASKRLSAGERRASRNRLARTDAPLPSAPAPNKFEYDLEFRRLVYMPELEGEIERGDLRRLNEVTLLDLRSEPALNDFMRACEKRFKPVYSKLVMPIVRLAKLGYDYVGAEIAPFKQALLSERALDLMVVTTACEGFGKFKLRSSERDEYEDEAHDLQRLDYNPMISHRFDNDLWIKGAKALDKEFEMMHGHKSRGRRRMMFKLRRALGRFSAYLDPHRSAWFRRNKDAFSISVGSVSIFLKFASFING